MAGRGQGCLPRVQGRGRLRHLSVGLRVRRHVRELRPRADGEVPVEQSSYTVVRGACGMSEEPTNYCRKTPAGIRCDGGNALSELGGCAGAGRARLGRFVNIAVQNRNTSAICFFPSVILFPSRGPSRRACRFALLALLLAQLLCVRVSVCRVRAHNRVCVAHTALCTPCSSCSLCKSARSSLFRCPGLGWVF